MASSLSSIAAKDGAAATVTGGILAVDKSGAGTGPFFAAQTIVDTQGVNTATVKAASTAAVATDTSMVVSLNPNTIPAVTQSGTWTVQPGNTANTTAWKVDGSAVTQPVSLTSTTITGTVAVTESGTWTVQPGNTANTTPWLAKIGDGTNTAAIKAASTAPGATDPAIVVAISPNSVNANGQTTMSASAPVAIASNQSTLSIATDTSQVANGVSGTMLTPTKVKISVASATTTTLVALQAAKKLRILSMYLVSTAANTVTFQSHTTTTNSDGGAAFAANGGYVLPFNPIGWFDTTAGEALDMVTSGAGQVSGQLTYVAV